MFLLLFFLLKSVASLTSPEGQAEAKEPKLTDISGYCDPEAIPDTEPCSEGSSYVPQEWGAFFRRNRGIPSGWCYISYSAEKLAEKVDTSVFQCLKFHIGLPKISDCDCDIDKSDLNDIRQNEMQHPLLVQYHEQLLDYERKLEDRPDLNSVMDKIRKKLQIFEEFQVCEYAYAKRIVAKLVPFLVENGFRFKVTQNTLFMHGSNEIPHKSGKLLVVYSRMREALKGYILCLPAATTEKAKELIAGVSHLLGELTLEKFDWHHPSEAKISMGLYSRYGNCIGNFPGDFHSVANDVKTICTNAKNQIIRCGDGRAFLYPSGSGDEKTSDYLLLSNYNTARWKDIAKRIPEDESEYHAKVPGDPKEYVFKDEFWKFLGKIEALGKTQRENQCQWVKDFYSESGIEVQSWPDGPGEKLPGGPDIDIPEDLKLGVDE